MKAQHTARYWARQALTRLFPSGFYRGLDRSRRWRRYRKAGIVFVHVPKAAGSSIAAVLYGGRLGHHPAAGLMREDPEGWAALDKFAIVRRPVSRFLSAFAFAMAGGSAEGAVRWRPEYERREFRDANVFVRDYLAQGRIYDKDLMFWPQSHFVSDASGFPVAGLRLFTTEQFAAVEKYLRERGHSAPARLNRTRQAPGLNLELTSETCERLATLYEADLRWFRPLETT